MITKSVIEEVYKRYRKRPKSVDDLNVGLLFEGVHPDHCVEFVGDCVSVGSVPEQSPFRSIPMSAIHGIVDFEGHVAVVMHSSILFLNKENAGVSVHIKPFKPSLWARLKGIFNRRQVV